MTGRPGSRVVVGLLVAGALAFRWRPQRAWLLGTAGLGIGVAAVWLLTRTAGLPGEDTEAVGFPDTLASVLEVAAAALALSLAFGWLADRAVRRPSLALTGVPALALVGLVTASVVPSLGGGHGDGGAGGHDDGHAAGGDHGAGGDMAADHHDGAAAPADWDAQRIAALSGNLPDDEVGNCRQFALLLKNEAQRRGAVFEFGSDVQSIAAGSARAFILAQIAACRPALAWAISSSGREPDRIATIRALVNVMFSGSPPRPRLVGTRTLTFGIVSLAVIARYRQGIDLALPDSIQGLIGGFELGS